MAGSPLGAGGADTSFSKGKRGSGCSVFDPPKGVDLTSPVEARPEVSGLRFGVAEGVSDHKTSGRLSYRTTRRDTMTD